MTSNDERETPGQGNNPNKGLDTKKFLISVGAFLAFALVCVLLFSFWTARTGRPVPNRETPAGGGNTVEQKGH